MHFLTDLHCTDIINYTVNKLKFTKKCHILHTFLFSSPVLPDLPPRLLTEFLQLLLSHLSHLLLVFLLKINITFPYLHLFHVKYDMISCNVYCCK